MAATIYFSETRDFKIIRNLIIEEKNEYLVYIYADTKNTKIPRDLIKDLPVFGNNIIWINSSDMDSSQIINHVALTIGQYFDVEDPISFVITSHTSRYDKAISLFKSQNVSVELIGVSVEKPAKKKSGKRGRPKGSKNKTTISAFTQELATESMPKKKAGRPKGSKNKTKKSASPQEIVIDLAEKEEKPVKKARKQREDKQVSGEMIEASLAKFPSTDNSVIQIQKIVFGLRKVQRPKYDHKLSQLIQKVLSVEADNALDVIQQMKDTGMMDNSGKANRLMYKD